MAEELLPPEIADTYDTVCDAVLRGADDVALAAVDELVTLLRAHPDGEDLALLIGLDLIEGWLSVDEDAAAERSSLILAVIRIAEHFPQPVYADAYELRAMELYEVAPQMSVDLLRRAVAIADPGDEQAHFLLSLAQGLIGMDDVTPEALALVQQAGAMASDPATAEHASTLEIHLLCELDPPQAAQRALARIAVGDPIESADLGEALMQALLIEAGRCETADLPFAAEVAAGLRLGLGRADWLPDPLTESDFATLVAWIDVNRDDLSQLASTMAAANGPFSDLDFEAQAALLRVMVAVDRLDVVGIEDALRKAAPLVSASGSPGLVTVYRIIAELVNTSRSGVPLADIAAEFRGLQQSRGREPDAETTLMNEVIQGFGQVWNGAARGLPPATRTRLDEWCSDPARRHSDHLTQALLWTSAAASSVFDGDLAAARARLSEAEQLRDYLDPKSSQSQWIDMMIGGIAPVVGADVDRTKVGHQLQQVAAEHHRRGNLLAAATFDGQVAITLEEDDPEAALAAGVRALDFHALRSASLMGSAEREAFRAGSRKVVASSLRAASRLNDPRPLAELLEFLRAQEVPTVPDEADLERLPLALLLPPPAFGDDAATMTSLVDAVSLPIPRRVRMPWGVVAMAKYLPLAVTDEVVDVVVPISRFPDQNPTRSIGQRSDS